MYFLTVTLLTLAALTGATPAANTRGTNAERFARGLPPLPPRFSETLPGLVKYLHNYTPSRVFGAKRSTPSASPVVVYTGRIEVRKSTGETLGFVENLAGTCTVGGINKGPLTDELHVSFATGTSTRPSGPFDIQVTNPNFVAPFFLGTSTTSASEDIGPGSSNFLSFSNVPQTPPGSSPVVEQDGSLVESAVWFYDALTKHLTLQYINPSTSQWSKPATTIAYDAHDNSIFFVGDLNAWAQAHQGVSAEAVTFYLADVA